ncbi:MAG: sigma-70 family RNA polymerase sigma factor [Planctomycetota bacterium]
MSDTPIDVPGDDHTVELLRQWHGGDRGALELLLQRDLPWIRDHVSRRLGDQLRRRGDTQDFLHDAVIEVLNYSPRFQAVSRDQFRRLLAQIVENMLRDQRDYFARKRRDLAREQALPADSVLQLDPRVRSVTRPSQAAERQEEAAWLRLALELLDPEDREVILLRQWENLEWAEIGARVGISEDGARMRFQRALPRLSKKVEALRRGDA